MNRGLRMFGIFRIIRNSMLFPLLYILLVCSTSHSQKVFSFDLTDPDNTEGYTYNNSIEDSNTHYYIKHDAGMFDHVYLIKGQGFICRIDNTTSYRLQEVYAELERAFGVPELIQDEIPEDIPTFDIDRIVFAVSEGKATIIRYWYEEKYNVKLQYTRENLKVFISFHKS